MDELWKALLPTLVETGAPLIATILSTLAGLALNALRRKLNHEAADRAITRLERVVTLAVHDVEQSIMPAIRAAAADGKITPEEAKGLKLAAASRAKTILGTKGVKELKASAGDIGEIISTVIEAKVRELRMRQSTPPPAA